MRAAIIAGMIASSVLLATPAEAVTSYCLRGRMADGSYTRPGSVANNAYRLGTKVYVTPAVMGRRRWVIRDRIGWGTDWDFWSPSCAAARAFGRRERSIRLGWPVYRMRLHRSALLVSLY